MENKNPPGTPEDFHIYFFTNTYPAGGQEEEVLFYTHCVRNRQGVTATSPAGRQHFAAGLGTHTGAKTMLIHSFSSGWLKCSFHRCKPV